MMTDTNAAAMTGAELDALVVRLKRWDTTDDDKALCAAAITSLRARVGELEAERDARTAERDTDRQFASKASRDAAEYKTRAERAEAALTASQADAERLERELDNAWTRESELRQAAKAAMDDEPGWFDLARDARNKSLSSRTDRIRTRALVAAQKDRAHDR